MHSPRRSPALSPLTDAWREVEPIARVRQVATRLVRVHALRAADALQLAAAIVAAEDDPPSLTFVTLDDRLARAAERVGFPVLERTDDPARWPWPIPSRAASFSNACP